MNYKPKILVYGFGNPGRQDDGLGVRLAERINNANIENVTCNSNYQLNGEDSWEISQYEIVVFIDASINEDVPFSFKKLKASNEISFTTHAMTVESVLSLCEELYYKTPESYMLAVRGYEWDFSETISPRGNENLEKAYDFLSRLLRYSTGETLESVAEELIVNSN